MYKYSKLLLVALLLFAVACTSTTATTDKQELVIITSDSTATTYLASDSVAVKIPARVKAPLVKKGKIPVSTKVDQFKMRKYSHVAELYMDLAPSVIALCKENKVPPAAILAIVSLESGWGSGYIGQITGNILSLNATKGKAELPALYLPVLKKDGRVLFDDAEISKYSADELEYQNRPASLKRDYRPAGIAGTKENLAYFKYHHDEKVAAEVKCVNDFIVRFVSYKSSIAAYREARTNMDKYVEDRGIQALFDHDVNIEFINTIGGRPNSFNFRETWPKKVEVILKGTGLVELTRDMGMNNMTFEETW